MNVDEQQICKQISGCVHVTLSALQSLTTVNSVHVLEL